MKAVIYLYHGSRVEAAKEEAIQLFEKVRKHVDIELQTHCFLELQEPDLSQAVEKVIAKGATQVHILPVLLLTAGHAKRDIPELIHQEEEKYPHIPFRYGRAIEIDPLMVDVVVDQIYQTTTSVEGYDLLFVGRGSSDIDAINDTETIVQMLRQRFPFQTIEKSFLAASEPKFESYLEKKVLEQEKSMIVIPYLLFTGKLIEGMQQFIHQLNQKTDQSIMMTDYLSHHDNVVTVLIDRVNELVVGEDAQCNSG
ncbi:sirohydrochlorin ferrochelatase [Gracilibacillus halophilus YIM-C55.5]|uniref:Sirohydrochlorin ferrochelatase n=1 Tax=Gracilibacillus halophilus YIM-C55.5 TaxID=1308866 RepID=N4WRZ6_9BACI|nr:sirohydrochlorin chelatase [Gracilibacillus halophilus]ENH97160.1 sirohydrochlorin ferrochelatase [Gracilibacillus halophilus YIM-C55.5]